MPLSDEKLLDLYARGAKHPHPSHLAGLQRVAAAARINALHEAANGFQSAAQAGVEPVVNTTAASILVSIAFALDPYGQNATLRESEEEQ